MVRKLPDIINELNLDRVLYDIHVFLRRFPSNSWKGRSNDLPLRTIKTIMHSLAKLKKSKVRISVVHKYMFCSRACKICSPVVRFYLLFALSLHVSRSFRDTGYCHILPTPSQISAMPSLKVELPLLIYMSRSVDRNALIFQILTREYHH